MQLLKASGHRHDMFVVDRHDMSCWLVLFVTLGCHAISYVSSCACILSSIIFIIVSRQVNARLSHFDMST